MFVIRQKLSVLDVQHGLAHGVAFIPFITAFQNLFTLCIQPFIGNGRLFDTVKQPELCHGDVFYFAAWRKRNTDPLQRVILPHLPPISDRVKILCIPMAILVDGILRRVNDQVGNRRCDLFCLLLGDHRLGCFDGIGDRRQLSMQVIERICFPVIGIGGILWVRIR